MARKSASIKRNLTRDELAAELDVHPETVGRYCRMGAPHDKTPHGHRYEVVEFRGWMAENNLSGREGRPTEIPDSPDLEKARLRKENALASKYELQVRRERGELVPLDDVRQWIGENVTTLRNRLLSLGPNVTAELEGRDAAERQGIIDARVIEYLNDLAQAVRQLSGGTQSA